MENSFFLVPQALHPPSNQRHDVIPQVGFYDDFALSLVLKLESVLVHELVLEM